MTPPIRDERAKRAFLEQTTASSVTQQRLRARLRNPRARTPVRRWALLGLLAAATLFTVFVSRPKAEEAPLALTRMPDHVQVAFEGEGSVSGTAQAPRIAWESGTVHVQVEPNQGIQLTVDTAEAQVRVIGTAFDVQRDGFVTEVTVDHGRVGVTCRGEPERFLTDGERTRCLPNDLPTLLRRVALLTRTPSPAHDRLETLDRAQPLAQPGSSAHGELLAHRVQALQDGGRSDSALDAAATYVGEGYAPRRTALLSFLAHGRHQELGCEARDLLEQAAAELPAGPEWLLLASCLVEEDPVRASALVDDASAVVEGDWKALAEQLQAVLRR